MDRFKLEDVDAGYDVVEPMRASSFDMSFTLGSYRQQGLQAAAADSADEDEDDNNSSGHGDLGGDWRVDLTGSGVAKPGGLDEKGRLHADDMGSSRARNNTATARRDAAVIAQKLDEKAQDAIALSTLVGQIPWRLSKRMQDVHIYRPAVLPADETEKLYFRVSCEVRASLPTIMEYLAPSDTRSYFDIESQVFPGLLHASVIKRMELPTEAEEGNNTSDEAGQQTSANFPQLQVKWHASRFAGRFVKPVDFFFVEYANIETLEDGRSRGFSYVRSVESFKGDELASRLNKEDVTIPQSVSKCKRAVINKGICLVTPTDSPTTNATPGTHSAYDVTLMMVIDFQDQFQSRDAAKIIHNYTERLLGIRELLYKTLFQPVDILPKELWKSARMNKCSICHSYFSLVRKLHHCRACGEAVCGQCSRRWVLQPGAAAAAAAAATGQKETRTRLCTSCSLRARSQLIPDTKEPPFVSPPRFSQSHGASPTMRHVLSNTAAATSNMMSSFIGSVTQVPRMANVSPCDVKVASAVSLDPETYTACAVAFADLINSLGDQTPHLMMVSYSEHHDGSKVYEALARSAPDTLFMGGTSSGGVYGHPDSYADNNFSSSRSTSSGRRSDRGPSLGLWGIFDPEGSFAVLNADFMIENPRDASRRCVLDGMRMLCMEPEDQPDFVWMTMSTGIETGTEEMVVRAVNEIVDCSYSIVGGCSARSVSGTNTAAGFARPVATQICSEGGNIGCVTTLGACFAICCPSVEITHTMFTCYEPTDRSFLVTQATGRELYTLDQKPAFATLNEGCHGMLSEFTSRPERFNLELTNLPFYYPLAREPRKDSSTARIFRMQLKTSRHQVIQVEESTRDMTLHLGAEIRAGEKLRMMSVTPQNVGAKVKTGFRDTLRTSIPVLDPQDVIGCLLNVSVNYEKILQGDLRPVVETTARTFPSGALLASVSHGQQGVLQGASEAAHANGMLSALVFTSRKKSQKLTPLRPLTLRRTSTC